MAAQSGLMFGVCINGSLSWVTILQLMGGIVKGLFPWGSCFAFHLLGLFFLYGVVCCLSHASMQHAGLGPCILCVCFQRLVPTPIRLSCWHTSPEMWIPIVLMMMAIMMNSVSLWWLASPWRCDSHGVWGRSHLCEKCKHWNAAKL